MAKEKQSYQDLKKALEDVLDQLQHEDTDIDEAVKLHQQGQDLLKQLEIYLGSIDKEFSAK